MPFLVNVSFAKHVLASVACSVATKVRFGTWHGCQNIGGFDGAFYDGDLHVAFKAGTEIRYAIVNAASWGGGSPIETTVVVSDVSDLSYGGLSIAVEPSLTGAPPCHSSPWRRRISRLKRRPSLVATMTSD